MDFPARDAAVSDLFARAGMPLEEIAPVSFTDKYLYFVRDVEPDEAAFLRGYGLGSWMSSLPRRFPLRVDFPLDGRLN